MPGADSYNCAFTTTALDSSLCEAAFGMMEHEQLECVAAELGLALEAAERTVALLEAGASVPFVLRYRKEVTGGLREEQARGLERHVRHCRAMAQRKTRILRQIEAQDELTDEVRARIEGCTDRSELEDLHLAHRRKRRTRGCLARERGLDPLAQHILSQQPQDVPLEETAAAYVDAARGVPDAGAALEGARHIIAEAVAGNRELRQKLRELYHETGVVRARVTDERAGKRSKYEMYYDFSEPVAKIPSHRVLAIRRAEKEGWVRMHVEADRQQALQLVRQVTVRAPDTAAATVVETAMADAYDRLIAPALETEVRTELKRRADAEAIAIFTRNLRRLLFQPPAGPRRTLGVEPGLRTACWLAAVDEHGKLLEHASIVPHAPEGPPDEARAAALALVEKHAVDAVAIGNGTGAHETDHFFRELLRQVRGRRVLHVILNESGASAYATSRAAREELPDVDPGVRRAVSIARRFQDPLAELVQVDPKAIGVGQYQHDVNQQALREALKATVGGCVNFVGVDLNQATAAQLSYVSGLDRALALDIVLYRQEHGPFRSRAELLNVPRIDEPTFEQAAGFVRVTDGDEPLDATCIHPERYELVRRMAADTGTDVAALLGNEDLTARIDFARYQTEDVGRPTLMQIERELCHPARDPRGAFRCLEFRDDIASIGDLKTGMVLNGTVTNVTNFGAFVDIGLEEDGLVHVSHLSRRYVRDPNEAVGVGDLVRVKVLSVDTQRRRIGLSIKEAQPPRPKRKPRPKSPPSQPRDAQAPAKPKAPRPPKRSPHEKATPEDIARLIAHFQAR